MKNTFTRVLPVALFGLLLAPALASAITVSNTDSMTVEQLEATIAKLQKQLAELKKGKTCFVSDASLSLGDGEDSASATNVKRLQDFLREKGYFGASLKSTGYFGKLTRTALIAYQKDAGIAQSGDFDDATRGKAHVAQCRAAAAKAVRTEEKKVEKLEVKKTEEKKEVKPMGKVEAIALTAEGSVVRWTIGGYAPSGFKVIWSKNENPTYPPRDGDHAQYMSNADDRQATLSALAGSANYYVRVCEYLGNGCGVYSNQVKIDL